MHLAICYLRNSVQLVMQQRIQDLLAAWLTHALPVLRKAKFTIKIDSHGGVNVILEIPKTSTLQLAASVCSLT